MKATDRSRYITMGWHGGIDEVVTRVVEPLLLLRTEATRAEVQRTIAMIRKRWPKP